MRVSFKIKTKCFQRLSHRKHFVFYVKSRHLSPDFTKKTDNFSPQKMSFKHPAQVLFLSQSDISGENISL